MSLQINLTTLVKNKGITDLHEGNMSWPSSH